MPTYELITNKFKALGFNNIAKYLKDLIELAEGQELSFLQFADLISEKEIETRNENRKRLYLKKARFPDIKTLEEFDFSYQTTIKKKQVIALLDFNWIDNRENLVFFGPSDPMT